LHRAHGADLLSDFDDHGAQCPKSMKLGDLLLRLAQRRRGSADFAGGRAVDPPRLAEIGTIAGPAGFGAVAVGYAALAGRGSDGPPAGIVDDPKLT
jgi:hypothetical protein